MHNKILEIIDEINKPGNNSDFTLDMDSLQVAIVSDSDFISNYNIIVNNPEKNPMPDTLCDDIIDQFFEAVKTSCNSKEDLDYIIQHYQQMIHELATEGWLTTNGTILITIDQEDQMLTCLAVAAYSYDYWSKISSYIE